MREGRSCKHISRTPAHVKYTTLLSRNRRTSITYFRRLWNMQQFFIHFLWWEMLQYSAKKPQKYLRMSWCLLHTGRKKWPYQPGLMEIHLHWSLSFTEFSSRRRNWKTGLQLLISCNFLSLQGCFLWKHCCRSATNRTTNRTLLCEIQHTALKNHCKDNYVGLRVNPNPFMWQ